MVLNFVCKLIAQQEGRQFSIVNTRSAFLTYRKIKQMFVGNQNIQYAMVIIHGHWNSRLLHGSEGCRHFVFGILELVIMSIIAWATSHLCPVFPSLSRPLTHLAFNLHTSPLVVILCQNENDKIFCTYVCIPAMSRICSWCSGWCGTFFCNSFINDCALHLSKLSVSNLPADKNRDHKIENWQENFQLHLLLMDQFWSQKVQSKMIWYAGSLKKCART